MRLMSIFKLMMGTSHMRYVKADEICTVVLCDVYRIWAAGNPPTAGRNDDETFFYTAMFDILKSPKIVEVRLAETFEINGMVNIPIIGRRNFGRTTRTILQYGGGATANPDESLTGNVQIYLYPKSIEVVNKKFESAMLRNRSSGADKGIPLEFTWEMVLAHELGHAYNFVKYGGWVEQGSGFSVRMENAIRARGTSNLRRTIH